MPDHDFVVVDTETTGVLQKSDRIVEIGIVRLSKRGDVLREYTTLVNPKRDVGAVDIHGITAEQVSHAPAFQEIAGDVLDHISGAIFVGHNVYFDLGMLRSELRRQNYELPSLPAVCTMRLARHYGVSARKLVECCDHFQIPLNNAHEAISDARATSQLLRRYLTEDPEIIYADLTEMPRLSHSFSRSGRTCSRAVANQRRLQMPSYIQRLVQSLPQWGSGDTAVYLDLLERVLEDRRITEDEAAELERVALDLSLSSNDVVEVHRRYLADLIDSAFADSVISEEERSDLKRVSWLLGMTEAELDSAILTAMSNPRQQSEETDTESAHGLEGKVVCFTGTLTARIDGKSVTRDKALTLAAQHGLRPTDSLTKAVDILVVADGYTESGKAEKARRYGTRIMVDSVFWKAIGVQTDASDVIISIESEPTSTYEDIAESPFQETFADTDAGDIMDEAHSADAPDYLQNSTEERASNHDQPDERSAEDRNGADSSASPIERRLRKWQRDLINLGLRNKLLNFKPSRIIRTKITGTSKTATIEVGQSVDSNGDQADEAVILTKTAPASNVAIVDELPEEVFQMLQVDGRTMKFLPLATTDLPKTNNRDVREAAKTGELAKKYTDNYLQTNLEDGRLGSTLLKIYQKAITLIEEQGINCLFLSFGILEWYEDVNSERLLKAPIVLLPVELVRRAASRDFSLKTTHEEPVLNPALVEKLRIDFGIPLPELPENFEDFRANSYLDSIQKAVAPLPRWRVVEDMYLDIFSFAKYPMFKEMETAFGQYATNSKIADLCQGVETPSYSYLQNDVDLDREFAPESRHHILESDSSQQRAILAAIKGGDLVIEGPPGTGKSQTIANAIADFLAEGKTILFVSEKMAALNVVYERLATCGLRDFCLKLHSQDSTKRNVYSELSRTLSEPDPSTRLTESVGQRLDSVRKDLNEYVHQLHIPRGERNLTVFKVLGGLETLRDRPKLAQALSNPFGLTEEQYQSLRSRARDLASLYGEVGNPQKHPWLGSQLMHHDLETHDALEVSLKTALELHAELLSHGAALAQSLGMVPPLNLGDYEVLAQGYETLSASPGTNQAILMKDSWNHIPPIATQLIEAVQTHATNCVKCFAFFDESIMRSDVVDMHDSYIAYCDSWSRVFTPSYWGLVKELKKHVIVQPGEVTRASTKSALACGAAVQESEKFIQSNDAEGRELFGNRWKGVESDASDLAQFANWMVSVRTLIVRNVLEERGLEIAASGCLRNGELRSDIETLRNNAELLQKKLHEICNLGQFSAPQNGIVQADNTMRSIGIWLTRLSSSLADLNTWCQFNADLSSCKDTKLAGFVQEYIEQNHPAAQLVASFDAMFLRSWLNEALKRSPQLSNFSVPRHEQKIAEFRELDAGVRTEARQKLVAILGKRRHDHLTSKDLAQELNLLQRELRKKARQLPVRKLIDRAPHVLKAIKPCFMMSPLSVAQYLDPSKHRFDVVIFDEASQIAPEDAVGSIIRGRQVIVVGDPKQLPPTNFFNQQANQANTDTTDDDVEDSVESILDEFASRGFPYARLLWHYRSKHESLIAFSNKNFYANQLFTFPSARSDNTVHGVQFQFVDGLYAGAGANPIEASTVADAVVEHIRTSPELSLGVGTFNVNQQRLIQEEIDKRRNAHPSVEFFFENKGEDRFFVKNLENIQGDDRDVIFISVGFGPERPGETPRLNFGAVSQKNGWRRLNVLFTRAKYKMRVFSSMHGDQIDTTKAQSDGSRFLREFLIYAERGTLQQPQVNTDADMESEFEIAVFNELRLRGLSLVPQVGQSGYRIDFGVIDAERPGRFLCGIECDGAPYHSSVTARDRDRLRQQVLEDLGWKLIRIWSLDWFQNKARQVERVLQFVERCRNSCDNIPAQSIHLTTEHAPDLSETSSNQESNAIPPAAPIPYRYYTATFLMTPEDFERSTPVQVAEIVLAIVQVEAPIQVDDLVRTVQLQYKSPKLGTRKNKRVLDAINSLHAQSLLEFRNEFVYVPGRPIVPRCRENPGAVCPEEFECAAIYALHVHGELMPDDLILKSVQLLGFKRSGSRLKVEMSAAIERLLASRRVTHGAYGLRNLVS